jgi:hypothetical protein
MKKTLALAVIISVILSSCGVSHKVVLVGNINMVSTRNIENTDYVLISTYMGGNKKEISNARSVSIEQAIDQTVKQTPGGEYLKNAKIYKIDDLYFAVEGDVWGLKNSEQSIRGLKAGDYVIYERRINNSKVMLHKCKITSLKNGNTAYLLEFGTNEIYIASIENLVKANFTNEEITNAVSTVSTKVGSNQNLSKFKTGDSVIFYDGVLMDKKIDATIEEIIGLDAKIKLKDGSSKITKQSRLKLSDS